MKLYKICVFNVVLILSFFRSSEASDFAELIPNFDKPANACAVVDCGQGTCHLDNSFLGFDCECYSDWKKFQIGPITLPPCIIPNCTLNLGCGTGSPSPPAPPPPPFNISDPCTFTWCNDGTCKSNGTGSECDCNAGSDNLLNKTNLPCFKQCSLGADCQRLGLGGGGGPAPAAPPPQSNSSFPAAPPLPGSNSSSPPGRQQSSHGSREVRVIFMIKDCWTWLLLALLPWL